MMIDIVATLQAEEARLTAEIEGSAAYRQREAVRTSIQTLAPVYSIPSLAPVQTETKTWTEGITFGFGPLPTLSTEAQTSPARRPGSKASVVGNAAFTYLRGLGSRVQSQVIVTELASQGITLNGKKPSAVLASILSHDERFNNRIDGRGKGYGLALWATEDKQEAVAGAEVHRPGPEAATSQSFALNEGAEHTDSVEGDEPPPPFEETPKDPAWDI